MPSNEFEKISGIMCSMRDEVCALWVELKEARNEREKDCKILEDNISIKQEIAYIKTMMKSFCEMKANNKEKENNEKPTSEIKKKASTQKLMDSRKERERIEKVRTFPIPSAPKLSEISTPSREVGKETKSEEKMAYSTALLSKEGSFIEVNRKK